MLTVRQILETILATFQDKSKFTQRIRARDSIGNPVSTYDPKATCYCVIGLTDHLTLDTLTLDSPEKEKLEVYHRREEVFRSLRNTPTCYKYDAIHLVNDWGGREGVLKMVQEALEKTPPDSSAA